MSVTLRILHKCGDQKLHAIVAAKVFNWLILIINICKGSLELTINSRSD
mgnify:CR=1 FL=1